MAILDDKGRLFGKINMVDLLIVLLLVSIAAGAYLFFFGGSDNK